MSERTEACETCRFWDQDKGYVGDDLGYCVRFPPLYTINASICDEPMGAWAVTIDTQ